MTSDLKIAIRQAGGKKEARKLRHNGLVPGVVYGSDKEPVSVSVDLKALERVCYTSAFFSHVIDVNLGKQKEQILPRDISFDPVTDRPIHVDFQRISKNSKIKVHVAIEFINEDKSPGMKKGGVLNIVVHQLECLCPANSIPEKFTLDLTGKEIGESIVLSDVALPKNIVPANPERDAVIATVVGSRTTVEDEVAETATEETTTEAEQ